MECLLSMMANVEVLENKEYALIAINQLELYINEIWGALHAYSRTHNNG
jgi:hypothetical protein